MSPIIPVRVVKHPQRGRGALEPTSGVVHSSHILLSWSPAREAAINYRLFPNSCKYPRGQMGDHVGDGGCNFPLSCEPFNNCSITVINSQYPLVTLELPISTHLSRTRTVLLSSHPGLRRKGRADKKAFRRNSSRKLTSVTDVLLGKYISTLFLYWQNYQHWIHFQYSKASFVSSWSTWKINLSI